MTDYKDKVVVITGAGTGIGYGMAKEFAKRGAKLAISDINDETLRKLEEELKNDGVDVIAYRFDVSNRGQMEKFARMTFDHFKRVDYCMHNAGVTSMGHALKIPETDYFRDFEVNTMGVVYAARYADVFEFETIIIKSQTKYPMKPILIALISPNLSFTYPIISLAAILTKDTIEIKFAINI